MKRKISKQEKAKIILELLREEKTASQIATEFGVHPNQLSQWKKTVLDGLPDLFEKHQKELKKVESEHKEEVEHLYKKIGHLEVQVDFLKKKSEQLKLMRREKSHD